ncbi:hypothetical protein D918_06249 [Trichuris suis]|uniref:Uncharacterized protein n=1 Tax=Trichuris suis TaxID=68888 RepID=A0A085M793_9BILA|nr:hypothetical protein M513_06003 [Trichuris suis]KHJ43744.1 hypothetical protein D918_06249 [Trichuris suis]
MKPCKLAWKNKSTLISPIRSFGSIVPGKCPESDVRGRFWSTASRLLEFILRKNYSMLFVGVHVTPPKLSSARMTDDDDAELEESILARFDCSPVRVELLA